MSDERGDGWEEGRDGFNEACRHFFGGGGGDHFRFLITANRVKSSE